eukprot:255251-Ditylum_brightwellii.AAC.1
MELIILHLKSLIIHIVMDTLHNPQRNPRKYAGSTVSKKWRNMDEVDQAPFIILAREEQEQYEKEHAIMQKVLDRISPDGFSNIFLKPVDTKQFPDYEEYVDQPMGLGTIRDKIVHHKYQAPEKWL